MSERKQDERTSGIHAQPGKVGPALANWLAARFHRNAGVLLVGFLAAILCFYHISARSIWNDEGVSIGMATMPITSSFAALQHEPNMALYYAVLRLWMLLGDGEGVVRALSAVAAVATVMLTFVLADRLFGRREAIASSAILAVNAYFIRYAQEARSYALLTLIIVAAMLCFVDAVRTGCRRSQVLFTLLSVTAFYLHFLALLAVAAAVVAGLLSPRRAWMQHIVVPCAIAILPLCVLLLQGNHYAAWIPKPSLGYVARSAELLTGHAGPIVAGIYCCALLVFLADSVLGQVEIWPRALLVLWAVLPAAIAIAATAFDYSLFVPRYIVMSMPAVALMVGRAIWTLPGRIAPLVAVALGCVLLMASIRSYGHPIEAGDDMRALATFMESRVARGDSAWVYWPQSVFAFRYYASKSRSLSSLPVACPSVQHPERVLAPALEVEGDTLRRSTRVWFIVQAAALSGDLVTQRVSERIRQSFPVMSQRNDFERLTLIAFTRPK